MVTLSLGPQPVPVPSDLAGKSQATATAVLAALHLLAGPITQATSMTVPQGDVISSRPDSGSVLPGRSVALVISTGKPTVAVPAQNAQKL